MDFAKLGNVVGDLIAIAQVAPADAANFLKIYGDIRTGNFTQAITDVESLSAFIPQAQTLITKLVTDLKSLAGIS